MERAMRSMMRIFIGKIIFLMLLLFCVSALPAIAAVGCGLNDPDRDVPRLFKESTGYKEIDFFLSQGGDHHLRRRIENRLENRYLALYAPIDTPYTVYEIYRDKRKVGYIHGVNQKGQFGSIQIFIAQDLTGKIKTFYIQKITGRSAGKFRDPKFYNQFIGLSIRDFDTYDPVNGKGSGKIAEIPNPAPEMETDFYGVLRGLKKNLVFMDEFIFSVKRGQP
jgi:hypothetical protein